MAVHADNARERVLDAFEDLLISAGDATATLDAVAAQAGLTKGGLLYHFRSRAALVAGLVARFEERTQVDLAEMAASTQGAAVSYLRVGDYLTSPLHRTTLAVTQLADREPGASAVLARSRDREVALLSAELGDPTLARLTVLFAEGLYARAISTNGSGSENADVIDWFVTHVLSAGGRAQ